MSRVGQWKFTELGAAKCIAQGDGYVMCRNKGRLPWCVDMRIWDESMDYPLDVNDVLDWKVNDK